MKNKTKQKNFGYLIAFPFASFSDMLFCSIVCLLPIESIKLWMKKFFFRVCMPCALCTKVRCRHTGHCTPPLTTCTHCSTQLLQNECWQSSNVGSLYKLRHIWHVKNSSFSFCLKALAVAIFVKRDTKSKHIRRGIYKHCDVVVWGTHFLSVTSQLSHRLWQTIEGIRLPSIREILRKWLVLFCLRFL